jgi:hypothetical protein
MRRTGTSEAPAQTLVCPSCGERKPPGERFCETCHLPAIIDSPLELVRPADADRRRRARKIKPQLSEGRLMRVAYARNLAEAEFIQGLLLEEGVPSLLRRSAGFDVPDFLAAGPRDVLVPESGVGVAREALLEAEIAIPSGAVAPVSAPKLLAGLLCALAVVALVLWLLSLAVS